MLSEGPFSARLHGLAEYVLGGFLIASPFIFGFEADAAVAIAVVGGVVLILMAATASTGPSLSGIVGVGVHALVDALLAAFLIATPFVFGFSDEAAPTGLFIGVGVVHLLSTIGTRFVQPATPHP
ncbi:MAG: SPW repeat protein [Thermoleophilia bacterium]|nr:SPW repeat protein [Thermoleophilia bacterium]